MSLLTLHSFVTDWNSYNEEGFQNLFSEDATLVILKEPKPEVKVGREAIDWLQSLVSGLRNFNLNKATAEPVYYLGEPAVFLTYYLHSELTGLVEGTVYYVLKPKFEAEIISTLTVIRNFDFRDVSAPVEITKAN
jgi:hypothetical protein